MCDYCNSSEEWDRYHGESEVNENQTIHERKRRLRDAIDRAKEQISELQEDILEWANQIEELNKGLLQEYLLSKKVGEMLYFRPKNFDANSPTYVGFARPTGWKVLDDGGRSSGRDLTTAQMADLLVDKTITELDFGKDVTL